MNKLTKTRIEEIAYEILEKLSAHGLAQDVRIYYNNKAIEIDDKKYIHVFENISPLEYFDYVPTEHIISISFEGSLYDFLHRTVGEFPKDITDLLKKEQLYCELGDSWNLSFFTDAREVEYTFYKKDKPIIIAKYMKNNKTPQPLIDIMDLWYLLGNEYGKKIGDLGGCVIGANMSFEYKGKKYEMIPYTAFQGELTWASCVDTIIFKLKEIGCENIYWNPGILD